MAKKVRRIVEAKASSVILLATYHNGGDIDQKVELVMQYKKNYC
jgi:hypothetical protein